MHVTVKISLKLNKDLIMELLTYEEHMKNEILRITEVFETQGYVYEYPFKEISNHVSWYNKGIVLEQAKICYQKVQENKKIYYNFSSIWSNFSYRISNNEIIIELGRKEYAREVNLPFYIHTQQKNRLNHGVYKDMTIVQYKHHWYAYIVVDIVDIEKAVGDKKMGIDVGIKNPAVVYTQDGKIKFFGNGRERSYVQRRYRKHIQKMQAYHQHKELIAFEHKLHRKLTYYDHKISKEIIDFAVANGIGVIVMEELTNMNKSFDVSIEKDIYLWSYRRIQLFIAYKARLAGMQIVYVNPRNTSKRCPACGKINVPKDRDYMCICGFHSHRDIVGARNIMLAL